MLWDCSTERHMAVLGTNLLCSGAEHYGTFPGQTPAMPHVLCVPPVCRKTSVENTFNQRQQKMQKRKEKKSRKTPLLSAQKP